MGGKYKIVMIRHGESEWNQKNLFCGWYDADLSDKGNFRIFIKSFYFGLNKLKLSTKETIFYL